ncbi:GAF domain-containing protein [Desulfovibrio sp. UCD-KL4C]|uniref:GAF domain-containing protein n=1 Tax=Desulfovibrio sp. UCD-KL4C TaxID=2578120 RepID=UPI0025C57423|nr:GAF domain-containing protein [Desulfovibrio sp. UCD-KL4C]
MGKTRLYKAIYEITRAINSSLQPKKVLSQIAEKVATEMELKGCFIRLLDRSGEILLADASYGLSERYEKKGPVEVSKSRIDQEVLKGAILSIADVRNDDRFQYPEEAAQEGLVSLVVLPLTARGEKVVGVLRVYSAEKRDFSEDELDFLKCVADLSGLALENARMFHALKRASELANDYIYRVDD